MVLNRPNEAIEKYYDSMIAHYADLTNQIQVIGIFGSKERPLHRENFQLGKHATLDSVQF